MNIVVKVCVDLSSSLHSKTPQSCKDHARTIYYAVDVQFHLKLLFSKIILVIVIAIDRSGLGFQIRVSHADVVARSICSC